MNYSAADILRPSAQDVRLIERRGSSVAPASVLVAAYQRGAGRGASSGYWSILLAVRLPAREGHVTRGMDRTPSRESTGIRRVFPAAASRGRPTGPIILPT